MTIKEFLKDEDSKEVKWLTYWGKNGKSYTAELHSGKLTKHQLELNVDQICDDVVWTY